MPDPSAGLFTVAYVTIFDKLPVEDLADENDDDPKLETDDEPDKDKKGR